jgi:hypothetical protein
LDKNRQLQPDEHLIFYILGKNNIKIPVVYQDGNCFEKKMGTSCIFGYISPLVISPDVKPPHPCEFTGKLGTLIHTIEYKDKKCFKCGVSFEPKYYAAYEFHHTEKKEKDFTFSNTINA